jgi:hypothetical protein
VALATWPGVSEVTLSPCGDGGPFRVCPELGFGSKPPHADSFGGVAVKARQTRAPSRPKWRDPQQQRRCQQASEAARWKWKGDAVLAHMSLRFHAPAPETRLPIVRAAAGLTDPAGVGAVSLLRHSGLAQPSEICGFGQRPDFRPLKPLLAGRGIEARDARIHTAYPASFG